MYLFTLIFVTNVDFYQFLFVLKISPEAKSLCDMDFSPCRVYVESWVVIPLLNNSPQLKKDKILFRNKELQNLQT